MNHLPKPFYEDDFAVIYHGRQEDIISKLNLQDVDLVLTDPPYGIAYDSRGGGSKSGIGMGVPRKQYDIPTVAGDDKPFDPTFLWSIGKRQIVWGAEHFKEKLPKDGRMLVWVKRETPADSGIQFNDAEVAWDTGGKLLRVLTHRHNGFMRNLGDIGAVHPTQKPLEVMLWCLAFCPEAKTVLDPFMGSGTTLRACKDLGKKCIGIDVEEKYCELAANRLSQQALRL